LIEVFTQIKKRIEIGLIRKKWWFWQEKTVILKGLKNIGGVAQLVRAWDS
jgi:hypothetical protein